MSSLPFKLGLPVLDIIPPEDGVYILRSTDPEHRARKLARLQRSLSEKDLITFWDLGFKPDHPCPVSMFFTEVRITIGGTDGLVIITTGTTLTGTGSKLKATMFY